MFFNNPSKRSNLCTCVSSSTTPHMYKTNVQNNVRPCVAENPMCRKIRRISIFTSRCMNRTRMVNLLLTSNIKSFWCGWFKEDVVEKNPRSLRSHWSFPAHRVFSHSGTDVNLGAILIKLFPDFFSVPLRIILQIKRLYWYYMRCSKYTPLLPLFYTFPLYIKIYYKRKTSTLFCYLYFIIANIFSLD